jgi:FkbM family methyltransferase
LQQELLRKAEMEAGMIASPADEQLRAAYFTLLIRFSSLRTGLSYALLPELGHPLYFRCGSTDVLNLAQVFRDDAYGFDMRATPLRILDLGAYAGYSAVYLARRFPQAEICCVEPCPSSFRLLTLNITPYRRIRSLNFAAWHSHAQLGVSARYFGDWGTQLKDRLPSEERLIQAWPISKILQMQNWDQVDFVKCDIEGAETAVFADPGQRWLQTLDVLAIETHEDIAPGASAVVSACFDPLLFEQSQHAECTLYQRRIPLRAITDRAPRAWQLINSEPGLFPIALQDVASAAWGFFTFDGDSCQLHPNAPGEAPARAIFPRTLEGQTLFSATLHHAGQPAASITFSLIVRSEDGNEILRAKHALDAQGTYHLTVALPRLVGRHHLILQTEMSAGSPHNYNAWARWLSPRIG